MVPVEKLDNLTRKNHQGAVAFVSPIDYAPLDSIVSGLFEEGKVPFLLLLDRITDVRNFGAIARTAECLGVHALVVPGRGAAQINGDALKTSAGALNLLPVCRETSLHETIRFLQQSGVTVVACTEKADEAVGAAAGRFHRPRGRAHGLGRRRHLARPAEPGRREAESAHGAARFSRST